MQPNGHVWPVCQLQYSRVQALRTGWLQHQGCCTPRTNLPQHQRSTLQAAILTRWSFFEPLAGITR